MCFSASASFGAGAVLSVIGVITIKKVQKPQQFAFACIPVIFAAQQISEGFLWLALSDPAYAVLREPATYTFLFFAQVAWPVWVPFSVLKIEEKKKNQSLLKPVLWIGTVIAAYLAYCLLTYPVRAEIRGYHISYYQDYPQTLRFYGGAFYLIATIIPPLLSSIRGMWFLGTAILLSYLFTLLFYEDYVVSVWCFFAAVISFMILAVIYSLNKSNAEEKLKLS